MGTREQSGHKNSKMGQDWEQSRNNVGTRTPKWWEPSGNKWEQKPQSGTRMGNKVGTKWEKGPQSGARIGTKREQSGTKILKVGQE